MNTRVPILYVLAFTVLCGQAFGQRTGGPSGNRPAASEPGIYVPYADLAAVISPVDKAVLMDRARFRKLLAAARANEQAAAGLELAQIIRSRYTADVRGMTLSISGDLTVLSLSDRPVAVPLRIAGMGLTSVRLAGARPGDKPVPAPLGLSAAGDLTLLVTGKGEHRLLLTGSSVLKEVPGEGTQLSLVLPEATAGQMMLTAPGDLEIHATAPTSARRYDGKADRTTVKLTLGGRSSVAAVLTGNGRREDQRPLLLGFAANRVRIDKSHQEMNCLYTVHVLRRGVRELGFTLDGQWTVTDVACPSLVRWSVQTPAQPGGRQKLIVQLGRTRRGTQAIQIRAGCPRSRRAWRSPRVSLSDAAFERGFLAVDTGPSLRVRGQTLRNARREDASPQRRGGR